MLKAIKNNNSLTLVGCMKNYLSMTKLFEYDKKKCTNKKCTNKQGLVHKILQILKYF